MALRFFQEGLNAIANVFFNGASQPATTSFYLILCNGAVTNASTMAQIAPLEVTDSAYNRFNYDPATGGFDANQSRHEFPTIQMDVAAAATGIAYTHLILIGNAINAKGDGQGIPICWEEYGPQTISPNSTHSFRFSLNFGDGVADVNAA
jgi:hypothetical protein